MTQYRKKSLITAEQWNKEEIDYSHDALLQQGLFRNANRHVCIDTKQGIQRVNFGDYIITNPDGERYLCNEKTFLETYEEVIEL